MMVGEPVAGVLAHWSPLWRTLLLNPHRAPFHFERPANVLPTFGPCFRRAGSRGVALGLADYRSGERWQPLG